jgi:hypothetical protein
MRANEDAQAAARQPFVRTHPTYCWVNGARERNYRGIKKQQ